MGSGGWVVDLERKIVAAGGNFARYTTTGHKRYLLISPATQVRRTIDLPSVHPGGERGFDRTLRETEVNKLLKKHYDENPTLKAKVVVDHRTNELPAPPLTVEDLTTGASSNGHTAQVVKCAAGYEGCTWTGPDHVLRLHRGAHTKFGSLMGIDKIKRDWDEIIRRLRGGEPIRSLSRDMVLDNQILHQELLKAGIKSYAKLGFIFPDGFKTWLNKPALAPRARAAAARESAPVAPAPIAPTRTAPVVRDQFPPNVPVPASEAQGTPMTEAIPPHVKSVLQDLTAKRDEIDTAIRALCALYKVPEPRPSK